MLIKMNFADNIQEFIKQGREQQKAQIKAEPEPEEKDETYYEILQQREEKIITDALYNSVIKSQYEQETNSVFNVQLSGSTFTGSFFSGNQLFTANCGDSRVIMISIDD